MIYHKICESAENWEDLKILLREINACFQKQGILSSIL